MVLLRLLWGLSEKLVVRLVLTMAVSLSVADCAEVRVGRRTSVRVSVKRIEVVADDGPGDTLAEFVAVVELDSVGDCAVVLDGDALFSVRDSVVDSVVVFEIETDFCCDGVAVAERCVTAELGDALPLREPLAESTSDKLWLTDEVASAVEVFLVEDAATLLVRRSVADRVPDAASCVGDAVSEGEAEFERRGVAECDAVELGRSVKEGVALCTFDAD